MSLSHAQLRRWFLAYNRKWFGGRLPEDMDVYYAPDDGAHGLAISANTGEQSIKVDTASMGTRYAKLVLLHEMVHHYTGDYGHGEKFQNGMKRLALLGAFKTIW